MDSPDNPSLPSVRPSFLGVPASFHSWARVGPRFWGGLLAGLGIGLFAAKFLDDLKVFRSVWVGFIAIVLLGIGQGIAIQAVRRSAKPGEGN